MARSQLAINCPAPLLQRLRAEAQRQQTTATALVLAWLEAGLDGRLEAPRPAPSSELEQRLAAVEARLDAIAAHPLAQHGRANESRPDLIRSADYGTSQSYLLHPLAQHGRANESRGSDATSTPAIPRLGDAITTGELADRLGVKRHALNERLRRAGGAALGFELDGWRCVGQAKPARGGPAQWQWAPAG